MGKRNNRKSANYIPPSGMNPKLAEKTEDFTVLLDTSFILTKPMNKYYGKVTFSRFHSKWRLGVFIFGLALTAGSILLFDITGIVWLFALGLLFAIYCFCMAWFGYLYTSMMSYKRLAAFYGEPIEMHVQFFPRFFRVCTEKGNLDFLYTSITSRIESTDLSILIVGTDNHIEHGQIIDKRVFEPTDLALYYDILEKAGVQI